MNIGSLLKKELDGLGYKIVAVARKTGIPLGTLYHYLCDSRPIPESKARLICLTFDLPLKKFGINDENNCQKEELKVAADKGLQPTEQELG